MEQNSQVNSLFTKNIIENVDSIKLFIKDPNEKCRSNNIIPFCFVRGYPIFVLGPHCKNIINKGLFIYV